MTQEGFADQLRQWKQELVDEVIAYYRNDKLVHEILHGEPYEYYPLGKYIVAAPGVCGGRPTIKYHRLDALHIIGFLERGDSPKLIARNYRIPVAAVLEAVELAAV